MSKYFGTDGFRGEANVDLTSMHAYRIGRFLGWYYKQGKRSDEHPRIVVGKDPRRSSYMLEYATMAGLSASGADAYLLHVTTTPSVSYITRVDDFDCGVMISASHNPFYDNGIKLLNYKGEKMDEKTIELCEAYLDGDLRALGIDAPDLPSATGEELGRIVDYVSGRNRYIGYLISTASRSFRDLRIGLDCANGSSWMIARAVFEALGARVTVINAQPDGININRDAGSTHIDGLRHLVRERHLDIGFAFDGDADRCLAVDENGDVVTGDHILYILGRMYHKKGTLPVDTVVATVMSNIGLFRALEREGMCYEQTPVGDKYVWECMAKNGYGLGGEESGHIIISKYATTGDGILTAIKLTDAMVDAGKPMSALSEGLVIYPQVLKNVRVRDKAAVLADPDVKAAAQAAEEMLKGDGRLLLRPSGTEPVVRVMAEASTDELCRKAVDSVVAVIGKKHG